MQTGHVIILCNSSTMSVPSRGVQTLWKARVLDSYNIEENQGPRKHDFIGMLRKCPCTCAGGILGTGNEIFRKRIS